MNDRALIALIALAAAMGYSVVPRTTAAAGASAPTSDASLSDVFDQVGYREGYDPDLLRAIAWVESKNNPSAINLESDGIGGSDSIGLMQVYAPQSLPALEARGLWRGTLPIGGRDRLYEPEFNVTVGGAILDWNLTTYGFPRGVAVYNRWASRLDPPTGPFGNGDYVTKVLTELARLSGTSRAAELRATYGNGLAG